jgi:ribosomal-protein-alanine N-acetyltransferase
MANSKAWSRKQSVFGYLACPEGRARDRAAGFVLCREAAGEAEILSIGVLNAHRRAGLGWRLMRSAIQEAVRRGAEELFLEVDETNLAAVSISTTGWALSRSVNAVPIYRQDGAASTTALVMRRDLR